MGSLVSLTILVLIAVARVARSLCCARKPRRTTSPSCDSDALVFVDADSEAVVKPGALVPAQPQPPQTLPQELAIVAARCYDFPEETGQAARRMVQKGRELRCTEAEVAMRGARLHQQQQIIEGLGVQAASRKALLDEQTAKLQEEHRQNVSLKEQLRDVERRLTTSDGTIEEQERKLQTFSEHRETAMSRQISQQRQIQGLMDKLRGYGDRSVDNMPSLLKETPPPWPAPAPMLKESSVAPRHAPSVRQKACEACGDRGCGMCIGAVQQDLADFSAACEACNGRGCGMCIGAVQQLAHRHQRGSAPSLLSDKEVMDLIKY